MHEDNLKSCHTMAAFYCGKLAESPHVYIRGVANTKPAGYEAKIFR